MLIYEEICSHAYTYEVHRAIFYVDKYMTLRNAYYVALGGTKKYQLSKFNGCPI